MTNKEKVLITFLVSVGVFSLVEAGQYIRTLSDSQKQALLTVVNTPNLVVCDGGTLPSTNSSKPA